MSSASPTPASRIDADLSSAIETFVRGVCFTRSFTHPYLAERVGPLWVMRDAPRTSGDVRNEEWIGCRASPAEIDAIARSHSRGRYAICAIHGLHESDEPLRTGFKSLGYRLGHTEPFFVHDLGRIPRCTSPAAIERVMSAESADALAKAARSRQILPAHFCAGAPLRQYVARIDRELVGWVRSIVVGTSTWCSNMYVAPAFRRRGIAKALLARMLRDDRTCGAQSAVLLASHTGALLYPVVGYRRIGTLLMFTPSRR